MSQVLLKNLDMQYYRIRMALRLLKRDSYHCLRAISLKVCIFCKYLLFVCYFFLVCGNQNNATLSDQNFAIWECFFLMSWSIDLNIEKLSDLDKFYETSLINVWYGKIRNFLKKIFPSLYRSKSISWSQIRWKIEFEFRLGKSLSTLEIFNMSFI